MFPTVLQDLRLAVRVLRRSPVLAAIAVLVITLGTGAVTTLVSAANAIALRALPGVARPDGLVEVRRTRVDGTVDGAGWDWASHPYYQALRAALRGDGEARAVADVAAWAMLPLTAVVRDEAVAAQGTLVSDNYFRVLGVRPHLGRLFTPDAEGAALAQPVAVLSHTFWTARLAADPRVIGRTVRLNGHAVTVVGVAPPHFHGVYATLRTDAWLPLAMQPRLQPGPGARLLDDPGPTWLQLVARMRDGAGRDAAGRELSRHTARHAAQGAEPAELRRYTAVRVASLAPLPSGLHGRFLGFAALLVGAAALVLLVAAANVASMLLARAVARRREMAVRVALGATRGRLVRQLLAESVLLHGLGAAGGVLVATGATPLLARVPLPANVPFTLALLDLSPDARVLGVALGLSLATGVAFGLVPALRAARVDLNARLRDGTAGAGARRSAARDALVGGQVAVSLVLLVAAGLLLRALERGRRVELGFDPSHVAVAALDLGAYGDDDARARRVRHAVRDALARTPGVVAVSFARDLPLTMGNSVDLRVDGPTASGAARGTPVRFGEVDAHYLATVRTPLVAGRDVGAGDDARAPRVAVVNEAFVRRFWPREAPADVIGRTLRRGAEVVTVVGVSRDAKHERLDEAPRPFVHFALAQGASSAGHAELLVRTTGDPSRLAPAIRAAVREADPALPAAAPTTLAATIDAVLLPRRLAAGVTAALGATALLLAVVGLYGLVAYLASQRTHEIGVRLALGASRGAVLRLVVGGGVRPVAAGLAVGLVLAAGAARVLASLLPGVRPLDAPGFVGGAALLTVAALAASYLPARRAAGTDPARVLRAE